MNTQVNPAILRALIIAFVSLSFIACNNNEVKKVEEPKEKFFPVVGFIRSQVDKVDSSLYSIIRIDYVDSVRTDTTFIPREQFAAVAQDFLTLPDIFKPEYANRYKEVQGFDGTLNRAFLLYTPVNPQQEIIKDQKVLIEEDPAGSRPTTIIVNTGISTKDSIVEKQLTWWVDRSFLVTITKQVLGQPETFTNYKVVWNDAE